MVAITHFPKTRLSELVARFGGISRSDAIVEARKQLDEMRPQSDEVIEGAISALEAVVYGPDKGDRYSEQQMRDILGICDQIVTLAGTFDYIALDKMTRSLCDVADGLLRTKRLDTPPIHVHMRAIRMVSPRARKLESEATDQMQAELAKIVLHYGFDQLSDVGNQIGFEEPESAVAADGS